MIIAAIIVLVLEAIRTVRDMTFELLHRRGIFGFCGAGSLIFSAIPAVIVCKRLRWPLRGAVLTPFAFVAVFYAVLNSMIVTLRLRGIRWRDTFYPLETLRAGNVF